MYKDIHVNVGCVIAFSILLGYFANKRISDFSD